MRIYFTHLLGFFFSNLREAPLSYYLPIIRRRLATIASWRDDSRLFMKRIISINP
jgi:hypothetical protein